MTQELMHVTVRRAAHGGSAGDGNEMPPLELEVSSSQTVGETKRQVQELDSSIAVDNLLLDGAKVDDNLLLSSFSSTTLIFTAERRTLEVSAAPVKRRKRCSFHGCTSLPLRGVGDCQRCEGRFCSRHRLMEQHQCRGLQGCKQQLHERNALRLQQQQTVQNKV